VLYPAEARENAGGAMRCSLINTINSITSVDLDCSRPEPDNRRQGTHGGYLAVRR